MGCVQQTSGEPVLDSGAVFAGNQPGYAFNRFVYKQPHPVFDPGGEYLYLLSERTYNEELGLFDFSFTNRNASRIYAVMLKADKPSPFAPRVMRPVRRKTRRRSPRTAENDRQEEYKETTVEEKTEVSDVIKNFRIDLPGLSNRIVPVPSPRTTSPVWTRRLMPCITPLRLRKDLAVDWQRYCKSAPL